MTRRSGQAASAGDDFPEEEDSMLEAWPSYCGLLACFAYFTLVSNRH
jgi:hypothetical protein